MPIAANDVGGVYPVAAVVCTVLSGNLNPPDVELINAVAVIVPVVSKVPATLNLDTGEVVPIPTSPADVIVIRSVLFVPNIKAAALR